MSTHTSRAWWTCRRQRRASMHGTASCCRTLCRCVRTTGSSRARSPPQRCRRRPSQRFTRRRSTRSAKRWSRWHRTCVQAAAVEGGDHPTGTTSRSGRGWATCGTWPPLAGRWRRQPGRATHRPALAQRRDGRRSGRVGWRKTRAQREATCAWVRRAGGCGWGRRAGVRLGWRWDLLEDAEQALPPRPSLPNLWGRQSSRRSSSRSVRLVCLRSSWVRATWMSWNLASRRTCSALRVRWPSLMSSSKRL
mmetsp:Transcript_24564/g.62190  ORF Transcript_24564/g.62190 Transcript_24564/m.62190 type:complete len:249 (+) Transcript_24564:1853-2599(+)